MRKKYLKQSLGCSFIISSKISDESLLKFTNVMGVVEVQVAKKDKNNLFLLFLQACILKSTAKGDNFIIFLTIFHTF